MFDRILRFAIEQRALVLLAVLAMAAIGVYSYQRLPIDAVPDITNVQVQVNTEAPGFSPIEAEPVTAPESPFLPWNPPRVARMMPSP